MDYFTKEADFESAVIALLQNYGWEQNVLKNYTEKDLIRNWANILFENNRDIDRLNNIPLIDEEMDELIEKIRELKTPLALNSFINGKTVSITRKNPEDKLHFNKEVSLKIYDRNEIAAGQSRYQIVQQPKFFRKDSVRQDRRGDLMLLINGMPVFHIELKRSGVPVAEAANQIKKYAYEGVFTGLFALVQVFVAMNPDETLYFANPGPDGDFKPDFYFHWADANNEPINYWKDVVERLLSIPMAHQLIGFYTVADGGDGVLKVMRSYQYYASNKISDRVSRNDWKDNNQRGGYIWHTTGSGKTMTSFKSAQLIANSKDADKVVFLMDRKELGSQSLTEYQGFADNVDDVQGTDDTNMLISKLKSTDPKNTLIVSSIQKMSRIKEDEIGRMRAKDIEDMRNKRLVFIIDECHRSTFGDMLITIKNTFPNALFFAFTGTPVFSENEKSLSTTTDIFGDELHRYSIADGIRDKNVLGFDPIMVCVYPDIEIRKKVAIEEAGASSEAKAISDPKMQKIYYRFMTVSEVPMAGRLLEDGTCEKYPYLKVTGLFDPTIDNANVDRALEKEDGIVEMLNDYNNWYSTNWNIARYAKFKLEVSERLAHKGQFVRMKAESQLDLLIVVNQMLTGFDSKWVNTLYLDKILEYQNLIQAFSRTNRLFNINEKPFGSIKYYRMPHTMKNNIENAMKLYSGDRPQGLFADHLPDNIEHMNISFKDMEAVFKQANIADMKKLPDDTESKAKFAKLFREFSTYLQAAKIQGFSWDIKEYSVKIDDEDNRKGSISVIPSEEDYNILLQRYKELSKPTDSTDGDDNVVTFTVDPYLSEQNTGIIDNDYMNSRFEKWQKQLYDPNVSKEEREATLEELHKSFAMLSQEEQKYANIFLHDIQSGDAKLGKDMTFRDYIVMYAKNKEMSQIKKFVKYLGVEEGLLVEIKKSKVTESNLDEFGRYDALKKSIANEPATEYYTKLEGKKLPPFVVRNNAEKLLRDYILYDVDIKDPDGEDPT